MSSVYRETTVILTENERRLLKEAIDKCKEIARDCMNDDMFVDAETIFCCVCESYKNGELPVVIQIFE